MRPFTPIVALAVLAVFSATAAAQEPVEYKVTVRAEIVKGSPSDHFVTFAEPIEMPDLSLSAGTYVFSLLGSSIVQVTSADRARHFGMFFTIPVDRAEPRGDYELGLVATAADAPRRLTKWFLPNRTTGYEFVYSDTGTIGER